MTILETLFSWVCTASLRASILVLLVLLTRLFFHAQLTAKWSYALWFPVLVTLVVPAQPVLPGWLWSPLHPLVVYRPSQSFPAVNQDPLSVAANQPPRVNHRSLRDNAPVSEENRDKSLNNPKQVSNVVVDSLARVRFLLEGFVTSSRKYLLVLSGIWLSGTICIATFTVASYHLTLRRIRRFAQSVDERLLARITDLSRSVGLRRMPRVLNSAAVQSPAVCGLFRPTLLLHAQQLRQLSDDEVDMVLTHELTHIHRGDLWFNSLLCLLLATHWFNPLLWIAFFSVRNDREAVCDDDVLRGREPAQRVIYGNALLKLEVECPSQLSLPFVGMLQSQARLKDRIQLIAHFRETGGVMKASLILSVSLLTFLGIAKAGGFQQPTQIGSAEGSETASTPRDANGAKVEGNQDKPKTTTISSAAGTESVKDEQGDTAGWGDLAEFSGLRSRLTLQTESTTVGKPIRFRLEVKNFGDRDAEIDPQTYAPFRVLRADFVDERPGGAPYIAAVVQTAASKVALKPGESLLLWEQVDLNDLFLLEHPDTYDVYAEGGEWANQTLWRDSNRIRIKLAQGILQPEQELLARLLPIVPDEWQVSRSFGDIAFTYTPSNLKEDAIAVQLLFRDAAMVQQLERQFSSNATSVARLGLSQWGEAMLICPKEANTHWPNCPEAIATVLQQFSAPDRGDR